MGEIIDLLKKNKSLKLDGKDTYISNQIRFWEREYIRLQKQMNLNQDNLYHNLYYKESLRCVIMIQRKLKQLRQLLQDEYLHT